MKTLSYLIILLATTMLFTSCHPCGAKKWRRKNKNKMYCEWQQPQKDTTAIMQYCGS